MKQFDSETKSWSFAFSQTFLKKQGLLLFFSIVISLAGFGADRYSVGAGGNWNLASTWSDSPTGLAGFSAPTTGDNVFIQAGSPVSLNITNTALTAIGNLTIFPSAVFSVLLNNSLYISGNWTNDGTFNAGTGTGSIFFSGTSGTQSLKAGTSAFNNLTHSGASTLQLINDNLVVNNTFLNNAGFFEPNNLNITATVGFTMSGGTFNGGIGSLAVGNFTMDNVGATMTAPSGNFTVSGNWNRTNGSFNPGTNTVTFNRNGSNQTISSQSIPFYNVVHTGTGVLLLGNAMVTSGSFTNELGAGNFDANGQSHTIAGLTAINGAIYLAKTAAQVLNGGLVINNSASFTGVSGSLTISNVTINAGGTLTATSGAFNVTGNWVNNGTFIQGANTVTFSGNSNQSISGSSPIVFNNLTVTNTSSAVLTFNNNITVAGLLTQSANSSLNLSSFQLTLSGAGTPFVVAGSAIFAASTSTVLYSNAGTIGIAAVNYYNLTSTNNARNFQNAITGIANIFTPGTGTYGFGIGTIDFNGTGNQTIPALNYNRLTTSNDGIKTLVGNVTIGSVLTVGANTTFEPGSNTIIFNASGIAPFVVNGIFNASSSTINYNGGNTVTIAPVNYYNLTSNGNSRFVPSGLTIGIANTFTPGPTTYGNEHTINFNGSNGAQSFSAAFTFKTLAITNPNGLSVGNNITVNTNLNFNAGKLNVGTAFELTMPATATITGAEASKYVNGRLRLNVATGASIKNFEVGDAITYAPVQLNFANVTGTGSLTISTTQGDHPQIAISEIDPTQSVNRTWNIVSNGGTYGTYNATFNFQNIDVDAGADPSIFSINHYIPGTNSWNIPTIGTRLANSTSYTGYNSFGIFQVGEVAAQTPCAFNANSNSGSTLSPCITDLTSNAQPLTISNFTAGQYFTLDVIQGLNYRIYTANTTNPADPLMLSIYSENQPLDPALAVSFSNAGNTGFAQPNNVYLLFTSPISGKIRVLINKKRDCASVTPAGLTVRVDTYGGSNTLDNQMTAGTNSWVAHMYDGITNVPFTGSFNNYLGYYIQPESFDDEFGIAGPSDVLCYNGIYSGGNLNGTRLLNSSFSVRYRMNSTKKGLYVADLGSDDGSRLAVDGILIYAHNTNWLQGQGVTARPKILMQLTGTSSLQLDYNEGSADDRIYFNNFIRVIGNELTTGLNQANCQGNPTEVISGDTLATTLPAGLFRNGNTTGYRWYYSLTPGGTKILLPNDTLKSFQPNTSIAPFNAPGTYYITRSVSLRSTNNFNASENPFIRTIESNEAILVVTASAPLQTVTTTAATFCYGNAATVTLASSTIGVNYQLRDDATNITIGATQAGTGAALNFSTGPLVATRTFNVTAINPGNSCTIKMINTVTFSSTPDGGKAVAANFGLVCVGNTAKVTVTNADAGVRYVLRNNADNTPVGDTSNGVGDDLDLEIPLGYLVDPITTFHVWALDIASGCSGKLLDTVQIATQSLSSPAFEIDQDFCTLDSGKVLLTPTNSTFASYVWSTDSTTTSIIIQQSGIYSLTVTDINGCRTTKSVNVGEELLINGDFSLGRDVGYRTGYTWGPAGNGFTSNPQNNGFYTIATNARNTHVDFWGRDHTNKTGNFMIINGENSTRKVWFDTVTVEANTRYYFSAWAMSLNNKPPFSIMRFKVNNILVGDSAILPPGVSNNSNYGWRRFYGQWDSGPRDSTNNRIPIEIVNLVPGNAGNDFGLDDISFSKLPPVKFFGASIGNGGNSMCIGASLTLTANLTGGQNPITYQWSGPNGFTSNADTAIIPAGVAVPGWYYLTAIEGRNCQSRDSVFVIMADPRATGVAQGIYKCQTGITINVTGMVPNSINNTITYTISGVAGSRTATDVDADSTGTGSFYIGTPAVTTATLLSWDTRTLSVTSINNGSCARAITGVSTTLIVKPNNNTWVGGPSGNWVDPWNWCPGLPGTATNVTIPTGTIVYINNNDSAIVQDILLQGNAVVKIQDGGKLFLYRDITPASTGKIDARSGTLVTSRSGANQTILASYYVEKAISTLLLNNGSNRTVVVDVSDTLKILTSLEFGNNSVDLTTNNLLQLSSNDSTTASIGVIPAGTGNVITGNFIVERYLSNARKWRLLAAPTNRVGQTVRNSWQENGVNLPGYGFNAADTRYTATNTLGFDFAGNNSSVKRYNPTTENWDAVANTDVLPISNERGYFVFVAGDRTVTFPGSKPTKLRTVGTINRGLQTPITVPANQFATIGNPYASRIDMRNINRTAQIDSTFYVWDPSLGSFYGLGAFNTFFFDGSDYLNLLPSTLYGPALTPNNFIESGMAVMVRNKSTTASGTITFEENDKIAGSNLSSFTSNVAHRLLANLKLAPQGSNPAILLDGAGAMFNEGYSNDFNEQDIKKMGTVGEAVSWKTSNNEVVVDNRFTPAFNDTLHLQIKQMRVQNYQWELALSNMDYPGLEAMLIDRYNNTRTALNMNGTTMVNFNIQNIPGSYATDRFKIVFKQAAVVLPVTITSITANRNNDKTVAVQWKVENELDLINYEVQRSEDGRDFTSIVTQTPLHNNGGARNYETVDGDVKTGDLFYRIKATSISGLVQYSTIVKVQGVKTSASIIVYPNPVIGKQMQVQFKSVVAGIYQLRLLNNNGQVVYQSAENVMGGSLVRSIQLNKAVAAGRYDLIVTGSDGFISKQQVIIQ